MLIFLSVSSCTLTTNEKEQAKLNIDPVNELWYKQPADKWENALQVGNEEFLKKAYPLMKGCVELFLDFLVEHPKYGWLVTNPSTSPENFPGRPGNYEEFEDEVPDYNTPGVTICAGSTIDMQILNDLFTFTAEASEILGVDSNFRKQILETHGQLAPMQIGEKGDLQEWLEDWNQKEESHRHISNLYGLFPGNQISAINTLELAEVGKVVLEQHGLVGNGWASVWEMGCWARLYNADKVMDNFEYYLKF